MKAVILAGGLGTRIREETEFRPKPMVEVGGRPLLWHIMKNFAVHGVREFVVCTGYRGEMIKRYFLDYEALSNDFTIHLGNKEAKIYHGAHLESQWSVTVVDTGAETNTGGRVKQIERFIEDDSFFVTYGDGLADLDLGALLAFHRDHGRLATLTAVQPVTRFGIVDLDEHGRVVKFREKPKTDDWVSAGFFVFDRKVFDYIDLEDTLEIEPLGALAKDGELVAFQHHGFWQPMDTFRELTLLKKLWDSGAPPWKLWTE